MARIRTIKPAAFDSDSLSAVSVLARWTFAGLWTYCDDEGRGRHDVRLIKAALFPLDDKTTLQHVNQAIQELAAGDDPSVCLYEVDGRRLLHIPKWDDHQRISHPTPSKLPRCSRHAPEDSGISPEDSVSPPEPLRPEGKGKERKGTGKRASTQPPNDPLFDEFWAAYPRKTDKGNARKAWDKALKKTSARTMILAAAAYAATNPEPKFTAHPTTWLNGERWDDQPANLHHLPESAPVTRKHIPQHVPDHIDPNDPIAYAEWAKEAAR
jgi:hypothetical protein